MIRTFWAEIFRVFSKKFSFSRYVFSTFRTILSHLRPNFSQIFWKSVLKDFFLPKKLQGGPCTFSWLFFFEIKSNNHVSNTLLWSPLDIFYVSVKIWINILWFHGAYEAWKCQKSCKIHALFEKVLGGPCAYWWLFFFEIESNNHVSNTLLGSPLDIFYVSLKILVNILLFSWCIWGSKMPKIVQNSSWIIRKNSKCRVALAHVDGFFSLKSKAIIMFKIDLYGLP